MSERIEEDIDREYQTLCLRMYGNFKSITMPIRWRCAWGVHSWSMWHDTMRASNFVQQESRCLECGQVRRKIR